MHNRYVQAAHEARLNLSRLNAALKTIGLDPVPGPDLDAIPTVTPPSPEEVVVALRNIKGDPGASKTVQALAVRDWAANHPGIREAGSIAWADAWEHARALLPGILDTIRTRFREHGQALTDHARGALGVHDSLDDLDLSTIPTNTAHDAADAISHYRAAKALHAAWRTLALLHERMAGSPLSLYELTDPSQDQFNACYNSAPQGFPSADPWSIARKGWKLDLANSTRDAQQRRNTLRNTADAQATEARQTAVRRTLKGGGNVIRMEDVID